MREGNVLNSCEVASDEPTVKVHGYSSPSRRSEISVSSLIGSSSFPVPALASLTTELAGTMSVGMLLGMDAVEGSWVVLVESVRVELVTLVTAAVLEVDDEAVEATMR
jgi:hypothetical protein